MESAARLFATGTRLFTGAWFCCTFLVGVVFVFLMPPFQTNDETHHWEKLYTVMEHDPTCSNIPRGVETVIEKNVYDQVRGGWKWEFRRADDAFAVRLGNRMVPSYNASCGYPSTSYWFPALLARASQRLWPSEWGGIMVAFYAARLGNWLVLSICVWLGITLLPRLRTWLLTVFSVPMVIHQSASINQDSTIVGLSILLLVVLFRATPLLKLIGIAVLVWLLSGMKPVFAPLGLLMTIPLWEPAGRWGARRRRQIFAGLLALSGLVLLSSPLWFATLLRRTCGTMWTVPWADSARQTDYIISRPWIFWDALGQQLADNLGHGHLVGGFTSIIGIFGWAQYEVPCYEGVITAAVLALLADIVSPIDVAMTTRRREGWLHLFWCRVVPGLSPFLVVFLIDLAFYLVFTVPASQFVIGVQGRYYFASLVLIGAGIVWCVAGDLERLAASLKRYAAQIVAARSLLALLLGAKAFYEMAVAWNISYDLISNVYYHHYPWNS